jgi:hypothetical protein
MSMAKVSSRKVDSVYTPQQGTLALVLGNFVLMCITIFRCIKV